MNLSLRDIDQNNFTECINLTLPEDQRIFVSSNVYSIAESKIFTFWIPKAIYENDKMIGFIMYAIDNKNGKLDISRLMIDGKYQRMGFGKKAIIIMENIARGNHNITRIVVHVEKENENAKCFYKKCGFEDMKMVEYGEEVFILKIKR